ncbi:MAG: halocyanin domain-containing protein [Euryarchaeota archaeon]|nr:halocyanin domain-containing protein [Euryarchaeota archaeon]
MRETTYSRRAVVGTTGIAAITLLAGCSGGGSGDDRTADREYLDEEPAYGNWFEGVDNYNGTVDWTGQAEVTVDVGYNQYRYDPAAIAVSPGTTVTWEWTGMGGGHDVVSEGESGPLESDLVNTEGHTYSHTFEASGLYRYRCTPHESLGMRGTVFVE